MALEMNWDYIAGFFDGEGNINMPHGARCKPKVTIYQSGDRGLDILFAISLFLYYKNIDSHLHRRIPSGTWKPMYLLRICSREHVEMFLHQVLPYIRVKDTEALDFLRYFNMFPQIAAIHYRRDKRMRARV